MATMARVEAVALPPAEPPASALTNGHNGAGSESGSGAFQYLAPGPIMHAAELRQPAEGRGGAPGDPSSSSSEESARRSEAAAGREGRPRRRLPAPSSTLDDFMARRRQTVAGATPCFKSEPPGKLDRRVPSTPGSGLRATPARLRASCASPARAWRLWAPRCSQGRDRAAGRLTAASGEPPPERAATQSPERPLATAVDRWV